MQNLQKSGTVMPGSEGGSATKSPHNGVQSHYTTLMAYDGRRQFFAGKWCDADGLFLKRVEPKHILRQPPAIAIQGGVILKLKGMECRLIRVEVSDGRIYEVSFADFLKHGFILDRGFGKQMALPLDKWTDPNKPELQGSLFGGELR